jgi:Arc/MetJ family transcription regulator
VPVVEVRIVRMVGPQRLVHVRVAVGLVGGHPRPVGVLVAERPLCHRVFTAQIGRLDAPVGVYENEHCEVYEMMVRTNVVIDGSLLKEALRYSKATTMKDVIHEALTEFVANRRRKDLAELRGKIRFADGYDVKRLRRARIP